MPTLSPPLSLSSHVLAELLDGGQAFRWHRTAHGSWRGGWADVRVTLHGNAADDGDASDTTGNLEGMLHWQAPPEIEPRVAPALSRYLATDVDWAALVDALPWRSDAHLARCIAAFPGLRILRQPFGETLLGFLCSATKQIVQIKQMLQLLADGFGAEVPGTGGWRRLPTWPELARAKEEDLRTCALGFRARYIAETAQFLAAHPGWLETAEAVPYPEAKAMLCELPGVGEKVADCVLLFGAGRLEAFPVDTWILKVMSRHYGLDGWTPAQVAHFGRTHFGPAAGLAQQYLFAWERRHGEK